jgi:hypothetical protein
MNTNSIVNTLLIAGAVTLAMPAQAVPLDQGTWKSTLQARDLDGINGIDAFYDTVLKITWLDVNQGTMDWNTAKTKFNGNDAGGYTFGGYDDWRLPTIVDTFTAPKTSDDGCNWSNSGTDCGYNVQTTSGNAVYSEMASLFYNTLGNKGYLSSTGVNQSDFGLKNTGNFNSVQSDFYWSGTEYAPNPNVAWLFYTGYGFQNADTKYDQFYALAVRPGDVAAASVPEPETLLLAFTALAGLGFVRRRQTVGALAI